MFSRSHSGNEGDHPRDTHEIDEIKTYYERMQTHGPPYRGIDERTWTDLDMDRVFQRLSRTRSIVGAQFLYDMTRRYGDTVAMPSFEQKVEALRQNQKVRSEISRVLDQYATRCSPYLPSFLHATMPRTGFPTWLFVVSGLAPLFFLLLTPLYPRLIFAVLATAFINAIVRGWMEPHLRMVTGPFRDIGMLIATAKRLLGSTLLHPDEGLRLTDAIKGLASYTRIHKMVIPVKSGSALSVLDPRAYTNVFLLTDLVAAEWATQILNQRVETWATLFRLIGEVDAALSVAFLRAETNDWTPPQWTAPGTRLMCDGLTHPLISEAVPNGINLTAGSGLLLTGQNASGKSTLVRAAGVNVILASAWGMSWASTWRSPKLSVRTVIDRRDSIEDGHSYFVTEADAIAEMFNAAVDREPHLFLLDEILRGTSTQERIAAGAAVLQNLATSPNYVIATTHDREIAEYVSQTFQLSFFRSGDFRLQSGVSQEYNALSLMRERGVPEHVLRQAERIMSGNPNGESLT